MRSTRDSMLFTGAIISNFLSDPKVVFPKLVVSMADTAVFVKGLEVILSPDKTNQSILNALCDATGAVSSVRIVFISALLACIGLSMFWLSMLLIADSQCVYKDAVYRLVT